MTEKENSIEVCIANVNDFNNILDLDESVYGLRTRGKLIAESILMNECFKASTNQSNLPMQALLASCGYVGSGYIDNLDEGDPELVYYKKIKHGK